MAGEDQLWSGRVEVRAIHPFQARKAYLCPGCQQEILPVPGTSWWSPRVSRT